FEFPEAARQLRRQRGLPPEEHASLDEVCQAAQRASAAKRSAALEEKAASEQVQLAEEPAAQEDAHQVSPGGESGRECEFVEEEPAQASVGGADTDESQVEGRVSDMHVSRARTDSGTNLETCAYSHT
ncbi:hypothetical protein PC119_g27002, partial [Phytophthora cactorum]